MTNTAEQRFTGEEEWNITDSRVTNVEDEWVPPKPKDRHQMYQLVVRLPPDLAVALRVRAAQEHRPLSRVLRQALREYLAPRENP